MRIYYAGSYFIFKNTVNDSRDLLESRDSLEEIFGPSISPISQEWMWVSLAELMSARPTAADKNTQDNAPCLLDPDLDRLQLARSRHRPIRWTKICEQRTSASSTEILYKTDFIQRYLTETALV